jgi:hypothetical protein
MKEPVQRLVQEMVMMKANEIFNRLLDGQELAETKNEQIEPTKDNDEKQLMKQISDLILWKLTVQVMLCCRVNSNQCIISRCQNQDQIQEIPETMQMWQEAIRNNRFPTAKWLKQSRIIE